MSLSNTSNYVKWIYLVNKTSGGTVQVFPPKYTLVNSRTYKVIGGPEK